MIRVETKEKDAKTVIVVEDHKTRLEIESFSYKLFVRCGKGKYPYLVCSCNSNLDSVSKVVEHLKKSHFVFSPSLKEGKIEKYLNRKVGNNKKKAVCRICETAFNFDIPEHSEYTCSECANRKQPVYGDPIPPKKIPAVKSFGHKKVVPAGYYKWPSRTKTKERHRKVVIDI